HLAAGAAALPAVSRFARAQAYPTRPVRIIVGLAAGGPADLVAPPNAQSLSERHHRRGGEVGGIPPPGFDDLPLRCGPAPGGGAFEPRLRLNRRGTAPTHLRDEPSQPSAQARRNATSPECLNARSNTGQPGYRAARPRASPFGHMA